MENIIPGHFSEEKLKVNFRPLLDWFNSLDKGEYQKIQIAVLEGWT